MKVFVIINKTKRRIEFVDSIDNFFPITSNESPKVTQSYEKK